jgi:hypothetical protein
MKVALYARYSSDNQREASIADQFRVCLTSAEKQGWLVVEEYSDHRCVASASRCSSAHHRRGQFSSESNHYVNEKPAPTPARQDDLFRRTISTPDHVGFVLLEKR